MNRIQQRLDEELDPSLLAPSRAPSDDGVESETSGCHCVFLPKHYERNYAYPLVVWLHGPDDDERQVTHVMPHVSDRNYVAVGPRGTVQAVAPAAGYCWVQQPDEIERAEAGVMASIASARQWLNVHPQRIFLAGYGTGGTMAFRVALSHPEVFAGVLSFGGAFPRTLRPLANYSRARRVNLFVAAGREGASYHEAHVARDLRLFHAAGMSVCLRLYPGGDDLTTAMLADMDRWIMEHVAPQCVSASEPSHRSRRD